MKDFIAKWPAFRMVEILTILTLIIGWGALLLTLTGLFFQWTSYLLVIFPFLLIIWLIFKKRILMLKTELLALAIILLFVTIFSIFTEPSIFSGRDQGSLSEAAIRLAQSHSIKSTSPSIQTFYEIYGSGKALNFPGFYYTGSGELITQFPLPYIAWLAVFYNIFGIFGLVIANAWLFLTAAFTIYSLALRFTNQKFAIFNLLFFATTFIFSWIFKLTLSENLALALLWPAILFLTELLEKPSRRLLYFVILSSGLLFLTRIEGILFFFIISAIAIRSGNVRKLILGKDNRKKLILTLFIILAILIFTIIINFPAYREIGKAFLKSDFLSSVPTSDPTDTFWGSSVYNFRILSLYELISFFALALMGIIWLSIKKSWHQLIPMVVISPTLFYLTHSYISSDHPWMLRRFSFSLIPAMILYAVIFLYYYQKGKIFSQKSAASFRTIFTTLIIISLGISNLFLFFRFIKIKDNQHLLPQIEKISQNFTDRDLILIDRLATGDGWSMMTGPMNLFFGKQAVYFFNLDDLAKIDRVRFNNIYLISPDENVEKWLADLPPGSFNITESYSISAKRLEITSDSDYIPNTTKRIIQGKIIQLK
jgi:hypothetical protein